MRILLLGLLALIAPMQAFAATVNNVQGQTLANRGNGYRLVQGPTQVGPGATIVANAGSEGLLTYEDGCAVTILPGQVYTVLAVSPCQTAGTPPVNGLAVGAAVIGGTVGVVILSQGLSSASP